MILRQPKNLAKTDTFRQSRPCAKIKRLRSSGFIPKEIRALALLSKTRYSERSAFGTVKRMTDDALRSLLAKGAVVRGRITLSSGTVSEYYFDCKRVTLSSEGAPEVGEAFLKAIQSLPEPPGAIGGLTHGADPIIGAAMMRAAAIGLHLDGFYIRKEPKKHGTQKLVENAPVAGTRVVVVDDVVTKGGSVVQAIDGVESVGCTVVAVIVLVDRLEGGAEKIKARVPNARYIPLYTIRDFFDIDEIRRECTKNSEQPSPAAST